MPDKELHWFESPDKEYKFAIPERPTVRQQMEYTSRIWNIEQDKRTLGYWLAARDLIVEWESESVKLDVNIDETDSPAVANAFTWAGVQVFGYMSRLEDIPKN